MRTLILTRGIMCSGKSTWLLENGLTPYTVSSDSLRLIFSSPYLTEQGQERISGAADSKVWPFLYQVVERRMKNGEFTIVDATHIKSSSITEYKELASKYRYRVFVLDFTGVPLSVALERNAATNYYKTVPEHVIKRAYDLLPEASVPSFATVIKPDEFWDHISYLKADYSQYKKIHHIGDIHGCYDALSNYIEGEIHPDELYIFVGDYLDRGIQNREVLEFLITIKDLPNVILLEGNHEVHLRNWAHNDTVKSLSFNHYTAAQVKDVNKSDVRQLCRRLSQVCYYEYHGKTVLVTHGGLSSLPSELILIPTAQFIRGVGSYEIDIDAIFSEHTEGEAYQIHGHRNIFRLPTKAAERSYNLEGRVESGGHLRAVTLTTEGFEEHEIENTVFTLEQKEPRMILHQQTSIPVFIEYLQQHKFIKEKPVTEHICSYNFTRKAFTNGNWDTINAKARGLFINTSTNKIVSRSYDKFFNVDEVAQTKMPYLAENLVFPITLYDKPNGYLGILGYDEETDQLFYSSKSECRNTFAASFKSLFEEAVDPEARIWLKDYLKDNNVSVTFEVVLPQEDPHIIEYEKDHIILLDVIDRTIEFSKRSYDEVVSLSANLNIPCKKVGHTFEDWLSFYYWYQQASMDYDIQLEGFVIEDSTGFMTKLKLPFYLFWKHFRSAKHYVKQESYSFPEYLPKLTPLLQDFIAWTKEQGQEYLEKVEIVQLRNDFMNK